MAEENYSDMKSTTFIWTVRYPNIVLGFDVCSPTFNIDTYGNMRFYVKLVSEDEDCDHTYLSIYLAKHETYCGLHPVTFNIKLSVTNNDEDECFVEDIVSFNVRRIIQLERRFSLKKKKRYDPDVLLKLQLEIEPIEREDAVFEDDNVCSPNLQDLENLSSDLTRALRAKAFCDFKFRSIEGTYSVKFHKFILVARYPNLAATLNLQQKTTHDYNLGIDITAIKMLIQYLYSGNIDVSHATYGLHDILKRAELDHLEHILFPAPRIVHASTSAASKYGSLIWIVPKFRSSLNKDTVLVNTLCLDLRLEWTKIRILLYIRENSEHEDCLAFKIVRTEQEGKLYMLCKISLIGDEEYSKLYEHVFQTEKEWIITSFIERKLIEEKKDYFLINDTLKLRLEFTVSDLRDTSEYESVRCLEIKRGQFSVIARNLWALQRDFKNLYLNPIFSDFTLQVRDEILPAHKMILSARSPIFSRMIRDDTEENKTGIAVIEDFDPRVMRSLLCYVYCGEIDEVPEEVIYITNLYRASKTYQVVQLTEKCSRLIGTYLTANLVSDVLKFADDYGDRSLVQSVKDFVCCHVDEVFESEQWQTLMEERIDLTAGIMNAVLGKDG